MNGWMSQCQSKGLKCEKFGYLLISDFDFFRQKIWGSKKICILKGKEHPKNFFEIFKYMKVLNERNTVLFTKSKKLVSNSRDKRTKLSVLNHGELPAFKILKKPGLIRPDFS